ncbi:MAG: DUF2799 domain-containing protein [Parvularculaceae bacterium]
MRRAIALIAALGVSACAGVETADCGASAFAGGAPAACASPAGQTADETRATSVQTPAEYCTQKMGFEAGARGEAYGGVCAGDAAQAFLGAYAEGEKLFSLQSGSIAAAQALGDANKDLWRVKRRIMEAETRRVASTTPRAERTELNAMLKSLTVERDALQISVDRLVALRAQAEQSLAEYRASLAADKTAEAPGVATLQEASYP